MSRACLTRFLVVEELPRLSDLPRDKVWDACEVESTAQAKEIMSIALSRPGCVLYMEAE